MDIAKPAPLMVGNKAFYTLTSYAPVRASVVVRMVTDEEIDQAVRMSVASRGGTASSLQDSFWMNAHFAGIRDEKDLRDALRRQLEAAARAAAEDSRTEQCVAELRRRLVQQVPESHIAQKCKEMALQLQEDLFSGAADAQRMMSLMGFRSSEVEEMLRNQACEAAETDAALEAYARQMHLRVHDSEIAELVGLPDEDPREILANARAEGQEDELRESALRAKALRVVVTQCKCTYTQETPSQAHRRMADLRAVTDEEASVTQAQRLPQPPSSTGKAPLNLRLV